MFQSINPYNMAVVNEFEPFTNEKISSKLQLIKKNYKSYSLYSFNKKAELLHKVAELLLAQKEKLAVLICVEMGKNINEARAEIEKCALVCSYYASEAEFMLSELLIFTQVKNKVVFEPLGAIFAIMPWNFPFWQVFRFAAPALMAGNTCILKHAPNVCGCALAIEGIFEQAGYPSGSFVSLLIDTHQVEQVIAHPCVRAVTLTGSEKAGSAVAALAGKYLKKSVLELGGSDPLLVLQDADVAQAAQVAVQSRMLNAGQSCIASKRFLVLESMKDAFETQVLAQVKAIKYGNPLDENLNMGVMARLDLAENLHKQLKNDLKMGAKLLHGGDVDGCSFAPTLITNTNVKMNSFCEETFGPLAAIFVAKTEAEMVAMANDSPYGLGASVWSADPQRANAVAQQLEVGGVFINAMVKSEPRLPFGGTKNSGYGRELSEFGIKEFVHIKTISNTQV